jgi:hypothetical protein
MLQNGVLQRHLAVGTDDQAASLADAQYGGAVDLLFHDPILILFPGQVNAGGAWLQG